MSRLAAHSSNKFASIIRIDNTSCCLAIDRSLHRATRLETHHIKIDPSSVVFRAVTRREATRAFVSKIQIAEGARIGVLLVRSAALVRSVRLGEGLCAFANWTYDRLDVIAHNLGARLARCIKLTVTATDHHP